MKVKYNPNYPARPFVIVAIHVAAPKEPSKLVKTLTTRVYPDYSKEGHPLEVIYIDTSKGKNQRFNYVDHNKAVLPPSLDRRTKAFKDWVNTQRVFFKVKNAAKA